MGNLRRYLTYPALLLLPVIYWLFSGSGLAQDPKVQVGANPAPRADSASPVTSIRVNADLVLIPVMVTDKKDRLITGLERSNFRLFEDKVEQSITHFAAEDVPVSIGVVVDSSGSMGPKLGKARAAVMEFLRTANPEDEFMLIHFNDRPEVLSGFTTRTEEFQNRLLFVESRGRTALLDAIYLALNEMRKARYQRKAILILSDGGDNSSRYTLREVKSRVREADVQIYSIGILEPLTGRGRTMEEMDGPALLNDIADESGGRLFEVDNLNVLSDVASKIGTALRNQYILGYAPADAKRDGKYHKIQVKIARPAGVPPLRASFRAGYTAPSN